ncbi:MAG: type II secretion system F family protein [Planctomycetota bacterium]
MRKLHSIEFGTKKTNGDPTRIRPAKLADLLRLLLMLLENGLSLPKALQSLAADRSTKRYRQLLNRLRLTIEAGGSLSNAMQRYPRTFRPMQIQQIRIGERTGELEKALSHLCEQMERQVAIRKRIVKKVSYPILVSVAGAGLMIFMCVVVVPEFETVYASSGVDLPTVTRVVTGTSRLLLNWGWVAIPLAIIAAAGWIGARSQPKLSRRIDSYLLRVPILGPWLRDVAVLQFAEAVSSMIECGYKPVDAVDIAAGSVRNREVKAAAESIRRGVQRGEKLSKELEKHERFFSATLCQLIGVGEQSGDFAKAMRGTCEHLRERLETRIDATVGMLEPTLTILLATAIGGIVLSIYTPMFHMFEVLE